MNQYLAQLKIPGIFFEENGINSLVQMIVFIKNEFFEFLFIRHNLLFNKTFVYCTGSALLENEFLSRQRTISDANIVLIR